eukprot:403373741
MIPVRLDLKMGETYSKGTPQEHLILIVQVVDGDGLRSSHWKDDDTHQQQHQHCQPLIKGDKRKYYIKHRYSRRKICQAQSSFKTKMNQPSSFTGLDSISPLLKLNSYPTSLYDGQDLSLEFDSIIETQSLNEQKCCQKQFTANQKDWSGRDSKYMAVDQIAIQDQRQVLKKQNQQNYFQQNRVGNQISRKLRSKNDISKQHKVQMYQRSKVDMLKLNSKYQQKSRQNKHGEAPKNDNKTNSSEFLQITANDCKLITTRQLSQRLNAEQVVCQSQPVNYKDKTQDLKNHEPHRSDQSHNKRKRWHKKRSQKQQKKFQGYKAQHNHQEITKGIKKQKYIKKSQFKKAKGQLKKFALLGKRHNAPLNTTQFIINDMEDRQVSQNQENHMFSHWPLNKACFEEDKEYEFQTFSQSKHLFTNQNNRDSQISTTTGDVSEEESLARNEIQLMNEPGLSMEGFINDDMFEINLSEAEDFLYNEKTDNQMEFLQQNDYQQLEIDLESCDEDDLMKKLKSNQILIEALQKEAALKRNSCELFNQCR